MMGAMLSKFSRVGQIRSFKGEVVQDNQNVEECDNFSDESDTFYSEIYNYDNIVTIENDSNWINFDYLLCFVPYCDRKWIDLINFDSLREVISYCDQLWIW